MGFGSDYLDYFHYSDGKGYLIFCCQSVAAGMAFQGSLVHHLSSLRIVITTRVRHLDPKLIYALSSLAYDWRGKRKNVCCDSDKENARVHVKPHNQYRAFWP